MVQDARKDYVHALDVAYLGVFCSVAHEDVDLPLLEDCVLEGAVLALGAVDVLYYLLQVLPGLLAGLCGFVGEPAVGVGDVGSLRWLYGGLPATEQHVVVTFDYIQGHVDPSEKLGAPWAGISAVATFIVSHDLVEESLNGGEYLGTGGVILA